MEEDLRDGDLVYLRFLKDKFYIGLTTAFNVDFKYEDFGSEELTDVAFMKNSQLYDYDYEHDDAFLVNCYDGVNTDNDDNELQEKFHLNCVLVVESAYKNIDEYVRFESLVRLRHRFTGMYLTYQPENVDEGNLFTFGRQQTDQTTFIVHSVTKAKLESDPLEAQNVVSLQVYGNKEEYIGFNEESEKLQIKSVPEAIVISKFSPGRNGKYADCVYAGDVIRLLHIDTEGFLEGGINQTYFNKLANDIISRNQQLGQFFKFSVIEKQYKFSIFKESFNDTKQNTYGCSNLFLIQKEDMFDGKLITKKDNFKLKHLASDTYFKLAALEEEQNIRKYKLNINNPEMTFELKQEKVRYNLPVMIQSTDYKRVLKVKDILDRDKISNQKELDLQVDELEQGLNIFENFNVLKVAPHTVSDFIFLKDYRDLITQVIEYRFSQQKASEYFQLLKYTMISSQRMLNFLTQFTDDENDKEKNMRQMFDIDVPVALNQRRYKLYCDMHLNEYMFSFQFQLWHILKNDWDNLVKSQDENLLGKKQTNIANNNNNNQDEQEESNATQAIFKLYEVINEINNITLQSQTGWRTVKNLKLLNSLVDQTILSSSMVKSNLATMLQIHFKKTNKMITKKIIKTLVNNLELSNPVISKLYYRKKILEIFILISDPKTEKPIKQLQYWITQSLFGHLKLKKKENPQNIKEDKNKMFRFKHVHHQDNAENEVYLNFDETDETFSQNIGDENWKDQLPVFEFLTDQEKKEEVELYKTIVMLLKSLCVGSHKEMQNAVRDIFPMTVITSMLKIAVDLNYNMFPHDIAGHLMGLLVELYIKHYTLPPVGQSFSQQQKLKFNLDEIYDQELIQKNKNQKAKAMNTIQKLEDEIIGKLQIQNQRRESVVTGGRTSVFSQHSETNDDNNSQRLSDNELNEDDDNENQEEIERGDHSETDNQTDQQDEENHSFTQDEHSQVEDGSAVGSKQGGGVKGKDSNVLRQAIKSILDLVKQIGTFVTQKNFLKMVGRGERKSCLMFVSAMDLFKNFFLRMKNLDESFQKIIGYEKMTDILKQFNDKYVIEDVTPYKTMSESENLYLGSALKSVIDFVWIERDYKQNEYTKQIWYEVQKFAAKLILENPYKIDSNALKILQQTYVGAAYKFGTVQQKDKQKIKISDVNKFLRSEEKYHTSKDVMDREFLKQIKNSQVQTLPQDMNMCDRQVKDFIKMNNNDIIRFLPLDEGQQQTKQFKEFEKRIQSIIKDLYDKEFQFTQSLNPSKFQSLILDILGQEPYFTQSAMKILQKDFFPVSNIYDNIFNAQITTSKGESDIIKHMDDLRKKLKTLLYPNLYKQKDNEIEASLKKILPLFVSKPDQIFQPSILELFHVQLYASVKCKVCGRWYGENDVLKKRNAILRKEDDDFEDLGILEDAHEFQKQGSTINTENITPLVLAEQCQTKHKPEDLEYIQESNWIINHNFNHINHNPDLPEEIFIDTSRQKLIKSKGFQVIIFDFIEKVFFKISNEEVLKQYSSNQEKDKQFNHPYRLKVLGYCYKFIYYYILNNHENTQEIIKDQKLWECIITMLDVKDIRPEYYDIILDSYDIIIEVMQVRENIIFLKNRSNKFIKYLLNQYNNPKIDITKNTDLHFKIIKLTKLVISALNQEEKHFIREFEGLPNQLKNAASIFFKSKKMTGNTYELGKVSDFRADNIFRDLYKDQYTYLTDDINKNYQLIQDSCLRRNVSELTYQITLFSLIPIVIQMLGELMGLLNNYNPKKDMKLQQEILDYILDINKPIAVSIKCYQFFINLYIYAHDLDDDNPLYIYLKDPKNLKKFTAHFIQLKEKIDEHLSDMFEAKAEYRLSKEYLNNEQFIVHGAIPFINAIIEEKFLYAFFGDYLKLQKKNKPSYQKVLQSLAGVFFFDPKYSEFLKEQSRDKINQESMHELQNQFQIQQGQHVFKKNHVHRIQSENGSDLPLNDKKTDINSQYQNINASLKVLEDEKERERKIQQIIPEFIGQFKRLVTSCCQLGFNVQFITKTQNQRQLFELYNTIFHKKYIDESRKKSPYLTEKEFMSLKKLLKYLDQINVVNGSINNFVEMSMLNVSKFLKTDIIPLALRAMKKELLFKHEKSFQNTFEEKLQFNQILTQINDRNLNEEFFFFMSPFEDLLLYLVYNYENTHVGDTKDKEEQQRLRIKKYNHIISKKYKQHGKTYQDIFNEGKKVGENNAYFSLYGRQGNIVRIFQNIFNFIEFSLERLGDQKIQSLALNYMKLIQAIMYKYGATSHKFDYYDFKDSKKKLLEGQIREQNSLILTDIQNYVIDWFDTPSMVCLTITQAYQDLHLGNERNNSIQQSGSTQQQFQTYLIQMMKLANVLLSNYNEEGQKQFLKSIKGESQSFMMKNQMVVFGIQKVLRYSVDFIKNDQGKDNDKVYDVTLLAESMLKFFQDLCDGNNEDAQNYLRFQPKLLKGVNIVYEISVMADSFIENIKQKFFHYIKMNKHQGKIFKRLFGKTNRDYKYAITKKHRKFWNFYKSPQHSVMHFQPLIQCFKTIIELINGQNIQNIMVIINTLSPEKINLTFEFFNSYFYKFDFKIPNYSSSIDMTYYGCFASCQEYIMAIHDQNPDEALKNIIVSGQKAKFSLDVDEDEDDDDENSDLQSMNQSSQFMSERPSQTLGSNTKKNATKRSSKVMPLTKKGLTSAKIKQKVAKANQVFNKTIKANRAQLREVYSTREFLIDLQQKKIKFTQTMYELEKSILDFLNYLYQSKNTVESSTSIDIKDFNYYLEQFDYAMFLENLAQRMSEKQASSYVNRVILSYYSIFLANLNEEMSDDTMLIFSKFQDWERQDLSKRDHKKFMGSIEVVNEEEQIQRIFFKIPKSILKVWDLNILVELRNNIIQNRVKRDNPEDKVKSLFDNFETLDHMIEYQNYVYRIVGYLSFQIKTVQNFIFFKLKNSNDILMKVFITLSLLQNILHIMFSKDNQAKFYYEHHENDNDAWIKEVFIITALINLGVIIYMTLVEFIDNVIFNINEILIGKGRRNHKVISFIPQNTFKIIGQKLSIFKQFMLTTLQFWLYLLLIGTQFLGYTYASYFNAFGLIVILWAIDFTKEIINSVFKHMDQVIAAIFLSVIFLLWFVFYAYYSSWNSFYGFEGQMDCDALLDCLLVHFNYGYLTPPIWSKDDQFYKPGVDGTAWTFLFNLFVNIILTAIISGIIIDTFGENRENSKQKKDDTNNKCFICNINREEFERAGEDFTYHEIEEHNKYNYLYYNIAVKKLTASERNNIDDWIYTNNQSKQIDHVPIKRCLMLNQYANAATADIPTLSKSISSEFGQMKEFMEQMTERFAKFEKVIKETLQQ